ncbi:HPr family phosphocarrier protein [Alteromonas sp. McT4-15]|jgi:phosphocarrier protein NPr|uniref:HPr family phosphocarrier protein n=1 Tax=unclassified Alteromonas TaxID=2614992 RepID=UPI0012E63931|nr:MULTISPECIES: HPr family phosphocarrier protein [unclassified Alteromonas]GFD88400.1 phosphate ABC transporter permease [Tenacibaculum sp. KUL152]MCB4436111.1 HPr family phosphocarrier protein [Alteromonas sp. McT4-15]WDT86861.1 HPr family phosphocarrier protein [Alteromonas sp. 009811495]BCO17855.1 phosphate ABC transporter permease [Alteromonas sp. KC3]BCO21816.1 phosphate ABC transporter permease [Alteromonas sp. KC14]
MIIEKTLTIVNKLGLHARAATQLVQLANQFDAKIVLKKGDKEADANSVLGLMMLESHQGEQVNVVVQGSDAEEAMAAIEQLIEGKFNEAE